MLRLKEKNVSLFGPARAEMVALQAELKRAGAKTVFLDGAVSENFADLRIRVRRNQPASMESAMAAIRKKVSHHLHGAVNFAVAPQIESFLATPPEEWREALDQIADLAWANRSQVGKMLEVGGGAIVNVTHTGDSALGKFVRDAVEDLTDSVRREYGKNLMRMTCIEISDGPDWIECVLAAIEDPEPRRF